MNHESLMVVLSLVLPYSINRLRWSLMSCEVHSKEWSQHWIALKRNWTRRRMLADLDRDYQEAIQLIMRLEPQDFRKRGVTPWKRAAVEKPAMPATADIDSVETLISFHWRHINQHVQMLEKWRKHRARNYRTA